MALEDAGARRCCSRQGRQGGRSVGLARPGALRLRRTRGLHGTRPPGAQGVTGAPRSHVLPWGVALLLPAQARKALLFVGDPPFPRGQHVVERVSTDARPGKRGAADQGWAGHPPGCVDTEGADARADRDPGCRGAAPRTRLGRTPAARADGSPRPGCGARLLSTADRLGDLLVPFFLRFKHLLLGEFKIHPLKEHVQNPRPLPLTPTRAPEAVSSPGGPCVTATSLR